MRSLEILPEVFAVLLDEVSEDADSGDTTQQCRVIPLAGFLKPIDEFVEHFVSPCVVS